jgi:2-dehydro-3-deoxyglucarate aldolase/4-hydroxy-2-oxoheptanedioate aldolase
MGTPRSLNYGATPGNFVSAENRRTRCLVMIETPGALHHVGEIANLDTVDGLFMGPYDLSLTRGRGQYRASSEDRRDARRIAAAAAQAGKFLGMPVGDKKGLVFARSLGAHFISIVEDLGALQTGLAHAFNALGGR